MRNRLNELEHLLGAKVSDSKLMRHFNMNKAYLASFSANQKDALIKQYLDEAYPDETAELIEINNGR